MAKIVNNPDEQKREREPMSNKKVLEKTPYKEILNLFKVSSLGLQHRHFLYAFLDKNNLKKRMSKKDQKDMDDFFKQWWKKEYFKRGIIQYPKQLNEKLNYLIKKGWIITEGKSRHYTYHLTDKYFIEKAIVNRIDEIQSWGIKEIFYSFYLKKPFDEFPSFYLLCGLPEKLRSKLSDKEKKKLNEHLSIINKNLGEIYKFKKKKIGDKNNSRLGFYWSV